MDRKGYLRPDQFLDHMMVMINIVVRNEAQYRLVNQKKLFKKSFWPILANQLDKSDTESVGQNVRS